MNWLLALFEAVKAGFTFATKVTPSEKIQEEKHEEKKEARHQDLSQEIINDDFRYLKRRVEIDIENYLRGVHEFVSDEHIQVVKERVIQYRKDLVARRGIGWKKSKEWLEENKLQWNT